MAGFGTMPAGLGPFGLGTPVAAVVPPSGPAGSRYLNPASKDYQIDGSTGQFAQMPPIRQRVLIAVTTRRGSSSALPNFGIVMPRKMGPSFEAEITASIRDALRQMTDVEQVLRIDDVGVVRGRSGRFLVTLSYTDTTTGETGSVPVPT